MSVDFSTCVECGKNVPYYVAVKKQHPKAKWSYLCSVDCAVKFIKKMEWKEYQITINPSFPVSEKQVIMVKITNALTSKEPEQSKEID